MDTQGATTAFGKDAKIAARLCRLDDTKRIFLSRNGKIRSIIACDLKKDAAVRAAFVSLAGGMQKARAESKASGDPLLVANNVTKFLQDFFVFAVHRDVAKNGKIIASDDTSEMLLERVRESCAARNRSRIPFVGKKFNPGRFEERHFGRKMTSSFVLAREFTSFDFAGFDVGLIEGVDANDRTGDGRSDFPAKKFLSDGVRVRKSDSNDGMTGLFKSRNCRILSFIRLRR